MNNQESKPVEGIPEQPVEITDAVSRIDSVLPAKLEVGEVPANLREQLGKTATSNLTGALESRSAQAPVETGDTPAQQWSALVEAGQVKDFEQGFASGEQDARAELNKVSARQDLAPTAHTPIEFQPPQRG